MIFVLILIILEYIYIFSCRKTHQGWLVLILIILEYIYILRNFYDRQCSKVLILIILEYIYIFLVVESEMLDARLNPYYTGIHLHISKRDIRNYDIYGLNPYYTGIHLHKNGSCFWPNNYVLILIILEYIYIFYSNVF